VVGTYLGQPGPNGASELLDIGGIAPVTPEVPHVFQAFSAILDEGDSTNKRGLIPAQALRAHPQEEGRLQSLAIREEPNREGKGPNMNDNLISRANQERCP
jgi:hypothetical protein